MLACFECSLINTHGPIFNIGSSAFETNNSIPVNLPCGLSSRSGITGRGPPLGAHKSPLLTCVNLY